MNFLSFHLDSQRQINDCGLMPGYSFVPIEAKDAFKRVYGPLFKETFDLSFCSVVHKKSESYGEFIKFMGINTNLSEPSKPGVDLIYPVGSYKQAFESTRYMRKEKIFPHIKDHIKSIRGMLKEGNSFARYYSATLVVLQSSGYGKSKTFIELGADIPVLYSSLQPSDLGYPRRSYYMGTLVETLDELFGSGSTNAVKCYPDTACAIIYAFILRILYLILSFKIKIDSSKAIDLDDAIDSILGEGDRDSNFLSLFYGLKDICKNPEFEVKFKDDDSDPISLPMQLNEFDLQIIQKGLSVSTKSLEEDVTKLLQKEASDYHKKGCKCQNKGLDCQKEWLPFLFVIDEAHDLLRLYHPLPIQKNYIGSL